MTVVVEYSEFLIETKMVKKKMTGSLESDVSAVWNTEKIKKEN